MQKSRRKCSIAQPVDLFAPRPLRPLARAACAALLAALLASPHDVAAFPNRTVTIVVPFPAGGSSDVLARVLSLRLAEYWGQDVVVENRAGGASVHGTQAVAQAPADGYTLLAANAALAINEALSRRLPYHAARDFAPISLVARQPLALVTRAGSPLTSVSALMHAARERPGQITYGSPGHGSVGHLAGELLKLVTGVNLVHVPSAGPRKLLLNLKDGVNLKDGELSVAFLGLPTAMPHVRSGHLRLLGVTGSRRAEAVADVPAIAETFPGFVVDNWIGIVAPYGVSVQLVRSINGSVTAIARRPEFRMQLSSLGYEAVGSTPGQFQSRISVDIERYSRIVAAAGITMP
jgi:tripartite-type tricarboxylate transporter receptor subunit TctC